ncbi:MAG: segregation/condensation protein A [Clostridia bacterium]|nr:segregation/condensation protein A [Clostridia bacterium]
MAYIVSLKQFEGPLDLLLHLIQQAKVDIKDIFVSEITEQYLESMKSIDELDMDTASEFLQMAAILLEIKSRSLLPRPPEPEDPDMETPEQALIRRLEEYKLYKESAGRMKEFEKAAMNAFSKLPEEYPLPPQPVELTGMTLENLVKALERIMMRKAESEEPGGRVFRSINRDRFTIEQCVYNLTARLRKGPVLFSDMLSNDVTRNEIVSYFSALLEMLKLGRLHVKQEAIFDDILILPGKRSEDGESETDDSDATGESEGETAG